MDNFIIPVHNSSSPFDSIRQIGEMGNEYWSARDLQEILGYNRWENFENVIRKAMASCRNIGLNPIDHFRDVTKIVDAGATSKPIKDYHLTRYACYATAMNGDPEKQEIALAQNYFNIKTRQAELGIPDPSAQITNAQIEEMIQLIAKSEKVIAALADMRAEHVDLYELSATARRWDDECDKLEKLSEDIHSAGKLSTPHRHQLNTIMSGFADVSATIMRAFEAQFANQRADIKLKTAYMNAKEFPLPPQMLQVQANAEKALLQLTGPIEEDQDKTA